MFSLVELKKALDGTKKNARVYRIFALSVFVLTVLDCISMACNLVMDCCLITYGFDITVTAAQASKFQIYFFYKFLHFRQVMFILILLL